MKNYLEREKFYWIKILFDGILLLCAFFVAYLIKRGNLNIETKFKNFLIVLFLAWFFVTLFSKKFMKLEKRNYFTYIKTYFKSILAIVILLFSVIYIFGWYNLSRIIISGTILIFLIFEISCLSIRELFFKKNSRIKDIPFSVFFFLIELFIVSSTFLLIYFYRKGTFKLSDDYIILLVGIFTIWFVVSYFIHKFKIQKNISFFKVIFQFWKSEFIIVGLIAFIVVNLNLALFSRFIILGSLLIFAIFENIIVAIYSIYTHKKQTDYTDIYLLKADEIDYESKFVDDKDTRKIKKEKYNFSSSRFKSSLLKNKLKNVYLNKFEEVYKFIENNINLEKLNILNLEAQFSKNPYNIEILGDNSLELYVNLRKINDFRRINISFIKINKKVKSGGLFIGRFQSLHQYANYYYRKYPFVLAKLFLIFSFLLKRIMPKLPFFKRIYFVITKGRNRLISKAEALGRLYYCGFELISIEEVDNFTWFIVKKAKEPLSDKNPSYGPFFKQKRVGKNGKMIFMYKVRTMHPYSEFIHKYIYERNKLDEKGKIMDDFRITSWGKIFRALWIDELPMLFNWLKRDVKLIGVRPLTETFFNTYPENLQKERVKFKPGLIPPYYVDMPDSIEEVWKSEKRYLEKYKKHPLGTDFIYFFKALNNIIFHHAKSE